jgi:signal transduction histidine kinase
MDQLDFAQIFNAVPGLYVVLSPELAILAVSDAYLRATMTTRQALIGRNLFEAFPVNPEASGAHDVGALVRASLNRVLTARAADVLRVQRYDIRRPDGAFEERHWRLSSGPLLGRDGDVLAILHQVEDVTAQVRLQTENRRLLDAERVARAEAERVGHIKDEFLATLSHELRTPLNAILGWAQILAHTNRPPAALREGLATIERNAQVQKKLIEDLLDMSRIVSGKERLDVHRVRLDDVVNAVVTTLQPTADAKGVSVRTVADSVTPPLWADENRLQQVVWNLLSNAIKFTPRGGDIEIGLARVGSHVELRVVDTGIGMSPEFLPFAFDRFRQSDASTTRIHGGLGLGLAIVRTLVELHGGRVEARSDGLGRGSTFIVSLPRAVATALRRESAPSGGDSDADTALGAG